MLASLRQSTRNIRQLVQSSNSNFSYIPDQFSRFFMVKYTLAEDFQYKRVSQDNGHLEKVRSLEESGNILFGGNSVNNDTAYFLFNSNDERIPYDFIKSDPYYMNGLVKQYKITEVEMPKRSDQKELTTQNKYN